MDEKRQRALGYLRYLNAAEYEKLSCDDVPEVTITTPLECIDCLSVFLENGIWPGYLILRGDVWIIYLQSISEGRYYTALSLLASAGGPADLILYMRSCYKLGYQVVSDQEYDNLEKLYIMVFPALSFLNNTTNDDEILTPIVKDAIRMSGMRQAKDEVRRISLNKEDGVSASYESLNAEKSTSVRPVRSYEEVYTYLIGMKNEAPDTHWSLKVDGFNTKCLFKEDGSLDVAISRGRAADGWDYTEAIQNIIEVQGIDTSNLHGKITGESIVDPDALDTLRLKYQGKDYKTPKSTAGAMLRAPQSFDKDDYKYLHFFPFDADGLYKDKAFDLFKSAGFTPPPEFRCRFGDIPLVSLEEFTAWLDANVLDPMWEKGQQMRIGSDGVVLQIISDTETDRADKYSDLNIALKFSHWTEAGYTSVVKDILFEQRRIEMSVVLVIEPVVTRDMNVATRVSVGSPAILVNDNVRIGDTIEFVRKSEAINIYVGKR